MDIFIIRDGRQTGPFSEDAVRASLTDGTARPGDLGWRKGMAEWQALREVLKPQREQADDAVTPPPADAGTGAAQAAEVPATAKQKAFLKYLGAEFGENLTKQRAAIAVSDAMETPKLQSRIRKWQDEKLHMHADIFQDELDFRRANRTARYLERIQTEGAEVLKDATKAHVQVLVESLDKRQPGWEAEPESALWDYLLPAISEHFPQLVQPAYKGRLKLGGAAKIGSSAARGAVHASAGAVMPPPRVTGTFGAMLRGIVLGVIALGAILAGLHFWKQAQDKGTAKAAPAPAPAAPEKKETTPAAVAASDPAPKEPAAPPAEKLLAEAKAPEPTPENPPAPAPAAPSDPVAPVVPVVNAEKPATPPAPEEKPATPAPAAPAMNAEKPATPAAPEEKPAAPAAPVQRQAVKLMQGIRIMLPNGQVDLPSGTILRYLATEGQNVRVSWNNNVFFVPALATDVNEPLPAPSDPAAAPPAPGAPPAAPAAPATQKPKKPADDL